MDWTTWIVLGMALLLIGTIVWFTVVGWVKYPEERGKGGVDGSNWISGHGQS